MTIHADLEVQIGQEATNAWGTEVAPTYQLAGIQDVSVTPLVDVRLIDQLCGTRVPARQSVVAMVGGEASLTQLANYEEIPYFLQGIFGKVTATSDTGGGWTHAFDAPIYATDNEDAISYTLLEADGTYGISLKGATINTLGLSGDNGEPLELTADFIGKNVTTDVVGVGVACTNVTYIMGDHIDVYVDAGSDAFGGTKVENVAWSFNLNIEAGREVKRHLGSLTPTSYREEKMQGELEISAEMTAVTMAYVVSALGATKEGVEKNVRVYAVDADSNSVTIDFSGVLMGEPAIFEDVDGVNSLTLTLAGKLNSGSADWLSIDVSNSVQTLA